MLGVWQGPAAYGHVVLTASELQHAIWTEQLLVIDPNWLTRPTSDFAQAQAAGCASSSGVLEIGQLEAAFVPGLRAWRKS